MEIYQRIKLKTMSILKSVPLLFLLFTLFSCGDKDLESSSLSKSQKIINQSIEAHGGDLYGSAHYSFVFRGKTYQFKNDGNNYEYTKISTNGEETTHDVLTNNDFKRMIDGKLVDVSPKEIAAATGGINSVIYFACLPYKLNDNAVHSKYIESISIKDKEYDVIEVTFAKEGGGEDHDDEYYYWINKDTKKIDYLAYNYTVNDGGVRFRSAYNTRVIDGITFQDYINYGASVGTPLKDLPALYEAQKLEELSRVKTESVINLNK